MDIPGTITGTATRREGSRDGLRYLAGHQAGDGEDLLTIAGLD
jgi:hypothetical protein